MNEFWNFTGPSIQRGPRCFEVPYALNNLTNGATLEIGGNNSLFKWPIIRRGERYVLIDPIGTGFPGAAELDEVKCLKGDIRNFTSTDIGTFNNVLLVSVLEHIGLSAYGQKQNWEKWGSPQKAQLEAFRHCMSFVDKANGRMICTLPYGPAPKEDRNKKYESPNFLIRYTREMLSNLQEGYRVIDESFFILSKPTKYRRWKKVSESETKNHRSNVCFILEK